MGEYNFAKRFGEYRALDMLYARNDVESSGMP